MKKGCTAKSDGAPKRNAIAFAILTKGQLTPEHMAPELHVYKVAAVCTAASFYSYFPMKRAISFIRSRTFTWNGQRGSHSPQPLQSEAQRLNDK